MQGEISGHTSIVGLIGWPVGHSVSPAMHNAAFAHLGLDWRYVPLPVAVDPVPAIGDAVAGLRALGLRGANVTVPHKQAVMPFLDQLTPAARAIGAVNTIVVKSNGHLMGDNTDAAGFVADLRSQGVEPQGRRVLVLGAGGSARAVVYGLAEAGAEQIVVLNRTPARAQLLVSHLQTLFPKCALTAALLPQAIYTGAGSADLVVNCTSLGMTPHVNASPWPADHPFRPEQVVYDLVYNPPVTELLRQAQSQGAPAIGGLGMLIWQGAQAFTLWTGQPAPVAVMRAAAEAVLAARMRHPKGRPVAVRRAGVDDAAIISLLNSDVHRLHAQAAPHVFKAPSAETMPPDAVAALLVQPDHAFFLAELDGQPVGYIMVTVRRLPERGDVYARNSVYVEQISVKPEYQHRGCGAALIEAAKELARAEGMHMLNLNVWTFNTRAQGFFASQGFVTYNERMSCDLSASE